MNDLGTAIATFSRAKIDFDKDEKEEKTILLVQNGCLSSQNGFVSEMTFDSDGNLLSFTTWE